MATNVIVGQASMGLERKLSWIQRYMLTRFHPRSVFIDLVGFVWFIYYFWNHDWQMAIVTVIAARVAAFISVMNINEEQFAETTLGKIALLHLQPFNIFIQTVGAVVLLYGVWNHTTETMLGGVSLILLGHIFGWSRVDSRLTDRN